MTQASDPVISMINEAELHQNAIDKKLFNNDLAMWLGIVEIHQTVQSFKPTRDSIPHYWKYVLLFSGILKSFESTKTDEQILNHLLNIHIDDMSYTTTIDTNISTKKRLRVKFRLCFTFEENEWFEETELWKEFSFVYNDLLTTPFVQSSGVSFHTGKNPRIVDNSESSFFDFFLPIDVDDEDEADEIILDQWENADLFLQDIIPNSLYYFKNLLEKYDEDDDEDDEDDDEEDDIETESDDPLY
ncbi:Nucleosome assembly protein [Entamoeba marina]